MRYFIYTVIAIVIATVIAGFFIVGSPKEERLRRFDEQRIGHLQFLQSEILNYWMNKEKLPANLSALEDDIRGVRAPVDPETGASYEYKASGSETFSLCADFALPSLGMAQTAEKPMMPRVSPVDSYYGSVYPAGGVTNWEHKSGHACFERTIDKELYKPVKPR